MSYQQIDSRGHLTIVGAVRLRSLVMKSKDETLSVTTWLYRNQLSLRAERILNPGPWRISYGILRRLAKALGFRSADELIDALSD